jgi:hypothetical protein
MKNKKVIAVFKTHFDFGYTNRKAKVLDNYCNVQAKQANINQVH